MWCWKRLLRVPWTARRSNQSTLKEISPEYSLEGLMLKLNSNTLATWCEEPDPDAGKHWRQEDKGPTEDGIVRWYHWLNGHEFEQAPGVRKAWCAAVHGVAKSRTRLNDWTELTSTVTVLRLTIKGQIVGCGPIPWNPCPFPEIIEIILHSLAFEIIQSLKTNHFEACHFLKWPTSVCGLCSSLNKSTSYLSLLISPNSFCNET